ncbi:MAG: hypothetical protein H7Y42_12635, partial [Chitinophagaceae bacterium]|nr:hypothetical protein [Chitinophagaceae bacterium]
SQTMPAGYLGAFTSDRLALLVDEAGGTLVRTPRYDMNDNLQSRRITSTLGEDGTLQMVANTRYSALQQDGVHEMLHQLSREKVNDYLHQQFDLATYDINSFAYNEDKTRIPSIDETIDVAVRSYATVTGKRIFINPNIITRSQQQPTTTGTRKYDIELGSGYADNDTVEVILPVGYAIESLPPAVSVQSVFGKYDASAELKGNRLTYYRQLQHRGGRFSSGDFNELVRFYDAIYKSDRSVVVLVRN